MPTLPLPPNLAAIQAQSGAHRKGRKILIHGHYKTGKSKFAADAPGPLLGLCCGEPGLVPYLDKDRGDIGLEIYTANDFYAALEYGLTHPKDFNTIVIDNFNLFWEQILEEKEEEKGREIRGQDWREIKGPIKAALRKIMRSEQNVVITCWTKDILYTKDEPKVSGAEGKTVILAQDNPQIEKNVPYAVDLILRAEVQKDKLFRPTNIHTITFVGGRRPRSVPPEDLYTGQVWKFDSKRPVNAWDVVIKPLDDKWLEGAVDHLGLDPKEASFSVSEMTTAYEDQVVGTIVAQFHGATSLEGLVKAWNESEAARGELPPNKKQIVTDAKNKRKLELTGGK